MFLALTDQLRLACRDYHSRHIYISIESHLKITDHLYVWARMFDSRGVEHFAYEAIPFFGLSPDMLASAKIEAVHRCAAHVQRHVEKIESKMCRGK